MINELIYRLTRFDDKKYHCPFCNNEMIPNTYYEIACLCGKFCCVTSRVLYFYHDNIDVWIKSDNSLIFSLKEHKIESLDIIDLSFEAIIHKISLYYLLS